MQDVAGFVRGDGSASPSELRLWVERQFKGIMKVQVLGKQMKEERADKEQRKSKKAKVTPKPRSPCNIDGHYDHVLHSLMTDKDIGSGLVLLERLPVDGAPSEYHYLPFSGVQGVFCDRVGGYYRVGSVLNLAETLRAAGYVVHCAGPSNRPSPKFVGALVLKVNTACINLPNLGCGLKQPHSSRDLSSFGESECYDRDRRFGLAAVRARTLAQFQSCDHQPGCKVKVFVNGKVRDGEFLSFNSNGEMEYKIYGWSGWSLTVGFEFVQANVVCQASERPKREHERGKREQGEDAAKQKAKLQGGMYEALYVAPC